MKHFSAAQQAAPFLDPASEVFRRYHGSQFRTLLLNCPLPWQGPGGGFKDVGADHQELNVA